MEAGDSFFGKLPGTGPIPHYWIILAAQDVAGEIALVNFTTPRGEPKTQVVTRAFFPVLDHDSVVLWSAACVHKAAHIEAAVAKGLFKRCTGLPAAKLAELIAEGEVKRLIPREILKRIRGAA